MKLGNGGFTIIELMIATAIFAIILLLTSTTIIGISQTYIKGSIEGQTQQTARTILSDISEDIQSSGGDVNTTESPSNGIYDFCIGSDVYAYVQDEYLSSTSPSPANASNWVLVRYQASSCPAPSSIYTNITNGNYPQNITGAEELVVPNERIGSLSVTESTVNNLAYYTISIVVVYANNNDLLFSQNPFTCSSGPDTSFCAVSALTTTITPVQL